MEFVRALPAPRTDCTLGFADQVIFWYSISETKSLVPDEINEEQFFFFKFQINVNTHFVDASNVYGSNEREARSIRAFNNGQLLVTRRSSFRPFPSLATTEGDSCTNISLGIRCFRAGALLYDLHWRFLHFRITLVIVSTSYYVFSSFLDFFVEYGQKGRICNL